jgi:hypothetical protein
MITRKSCRYTVEYGGSFAGEEMTAQGVILDLSSEGCRARTALTFTKGEYLRVLIDVPRYEKPLHVPLAVIRWANGNDFGVEFIQMEPGDQHRLRELIRVTAAATALSSHKTLETERHGTP